MPLNPAVTGSGLSRCGRRSSLSQRHRRRSPNFGRWFIGVERLLMRARIVLEADLSDRPAPLCRQLFASAGQCVVESPRLPDVRLARCLRAPGERAARPPTWSRRRSRRAVPWCLVDHVARAAGVNAAHRSRRILAVMFGSPARVWRLRPSRVAGFIVSNGMIPDGSRGSPSFTRLRRCAAQLEVASRPGRSSGEAGGGRTMEERAEVSRPSTARRAGRWRPRSSPRWCSRSSSRTS